MLYFTRTHTHTHTYLNKHALLKSNKNIIDEDKNKTTKKTKPHENNNHKRIYVNKTAIQ